jgi:hypothetical protein
MHVPRRITSDGIAAVLLLAAAAVLVATPYDGGACRNVAAAYALPAASLPDADQPAEPASLAEARRALATAESDSTALANEQVDVGRAEKAAQDARAAADKADEDQYSTQYSGDDYTVSAAQSEVDFAQSDVDSAQSWLQEVQQYVADDQYGIWTQQDVQQAQSQVDDANAKLAQAQQALQDAQAQAQASASAAAAAQQKAQQLDAAADAAEKAAAQAANDYADKQSQVSDELYSAQSQEDEAEASYRATVADWSHQRRLQADHVAALNNVRASCRGNGDWRAAVAGVDVLLLAILGVRRWWPRLRRVRLRLPRFSLPGPWRRR